MVARFQHGPLPWHDALYRAILAEQAANGGSRLRMASGPSWSGPKRLHKNPAAEGLLTLFRDRLAEVSGSLAWDLTLWANVTHQGGSCGLHDHEDGSNVWSGVYFLTAGAPIHFPREGLTVQPEPGLMLLFPSCEPHSVSTQVSAAPRISIAVNASPVS
jgi:hypothetical protein